MVLLLVLCGCLVGILRLPCLLVVVLLLCDPSQRNPVRSLAQLKQPAVKPYQETFVEAGTPSEFDVALDENVSPFVSAKWGHISVYNKDTLLFKGESQ